MKLSDIKFEDRNSVMEAARQMHLTFSGKLSNNFMLETLTDEIYDERFDTKECFLICVEAYKTWATVQDQPQKNNFRYLLGIFKNMKQKKIDEINKKKKEEELIEARKERLNEAKFKREAVNAGIQEAWRMFDKYKSRLNEDYQLLIHTMLKQGKYISAMKFIEEKLNLNNQ